MASPQLAIAKVSFSAVLLRPDPVSCPRGEIDQFLSHLDATLLRCSPANVQKSKQWILNHVVQSPPRVAALGKYLTALANSFTASLATSRQAREPSSKRKRLHILYVLNDVLYHVHFRRQDVGFSALVEPFLPALVESAAAFADCPKHTKKISELAGLWEEHKYFAPGLTSKLLDVIRDAPVSHAATASNGATGAVTTTNGKTAKDIPFIMPAMHGDASVPWYDLPAANWLQAIEKNSSRPMNPSMIKPLQFMPGPADKVLIKAVQDLLADVDRIYAKDLRLGEDPTDDIDQLGQRVVLDEITGDVIGGETYYGWSRNFCDKMKQRRRKADDSGDRRGRGLSRSESRSLSRSSSRPTFKRRRMSDSRSSRSRSRSRDNSRRRSYSRAKRRPRSYSRSLSHSPRGDGRHHRSRSHSQDYSPPPPPISRNYDISSSNGHHQGFPSTTPPFPPVPPNVSFPFTPTPPPPPPNWQGPWPPPPPPPPPPMTGGVSNWIPPVGPPPSLPGGGWAAGPLPPGLPPPPPGVPFDRQQSQKQGTHFSPGAHGGRGDYRGGRGGGWRGGGSRGAW